MELVRVYTYICAVCVMMDATPLCRVDHTVVQSPLLLIPYHCFGSRAHSWIAEAIAVLATLFVLWGTAGDVPK